MSFILQSRKTVHGADIFLWFSLFLMVSDSVSTIFSYKYKKLNYIRRTDYLTMVIQLVIECTDCALGVHGR